MTGDGFFHNEQWETASLDALRALQQKRLQAVVRHVYEHNPVYRERLLTAGVEPGDIRALDDLRRLPLMTRADFQEHYPLGLACVPKHDVVQMHMSSGSTGAPVVMPYTQADMQQWTECMARCLRMAGAEPADIIQITPSFGLFNGGFGFYHGAEALGLFVLPTGAGDPRMQVQVARDFGTRIIAGVVSYGIQLIEVLADLGEDLPALEIGIFGAEPFSDALKKRMAEGLGVDIFDIYGMTETGGVGSLGMDCPAHAGIHVWEDHYLIEVVDPETAGPLPDGAAGELVVTALTREALPAVRYRTGDITRVISRERCACGRTHVRIAPIAGRVGDCIRAQGVCFFPSQVEQALLEVPGVTPRYEVIIEKGGEPHGLAVQVETETGVSPDAVARRLEESLGARFTVQVFPVGHFPRRTLGRARRVCYRNGGAE